MRGTKQWSLEKKSDLNVVNSWYDIIITYEKENNNINNKIIISTYSKMLSLIIMFDEHENNILYIYSHVVSLLHICT